MSEGFKPQLHADCCDAGFFTQKLLGLFHFEVIEIADKGNPCTLFERAAQIVRGDKELLCHVFQAQFFGPMDL